MTLTNGHKSFLVQMLVNFVCCLCWKHFLFLLLREVSSGSLDWCVEVSHGKFSRPMCVQEHPGLHEG